MFSSLFLILAWGADPIPFLDAKKYDFTLVADPLRLKYRLPSGKSEVSCFLLKPAAEALLRVNQKLQAESLNLQVRYCYMPFQDERTLAEKGKEKGWNEQNACFSRGVCVDVSLLDSNKEVVPLPARPQFSPRAEPSKLPPKALARLRRSNAARLKKAMTEQGFESVDDKWWLYRFRSLSESPVLEKSIVDVALGK